VAAAAISTGRAVSCHPDGRSDRLNWDLLNDGVGNPKNTNSMLLAHQTPPAMSEGVRLTAEAAVRSGYATIRELIVAGKHGLGDGRAAELSPREVDDLIEFVLSL
jgi:hypothetical protein